MPDEMFFTSDMRSLRRGKRVAARTASCRPCLVWPKDAPEIELEGVIMNMNAYGLRIRMMELLPLGTEIRVQLMRDDDFKEPFAAPLEGKVVRNETSLGQFIDHGVQLTQKKTLRTESRPVHLDRPSPRVVRPTRMHTIDITVGDRGIGRSER